MPPMKLFLNLFFLSSVSLLTSTKGFSASIAMSPVKRISVVSPKTRVILESASSTFDGEDADLSTTASVSFCEKNINTQNILDSNNPNNNSPILHMIKQQSTVLKTSIVVALLTVALKQLPQKALIQDLKTGTIIFMIGDWAAQILTHWKAQSLWSKFELDKKRFILSTVLGCIWGGYINPSIYATVEHFIPGRSIKLVFTKMLVTCSIISTWGNYTTMMFRIFFKRLWDGIECKGISTSIMKKSWTDSVKSCNQDFKEVVKDDLKIFPLYDLTCFSIIPYHIRPLSNALMASGWAMYMSIASAKAPVQNKD